ncbi:uncharacterized protein LOC132757014 [Ruditapes philippinarum]|uniref:uncharacterized protein LOC132757014 n=1 Tax=Ruditapes philippinarum TaxID=129788 RepID=UPI00295C3488|nr:uncharacterized protein LOC132757014 [Ruditapes philippinarum]
MSDKYRLPDYEESAVTSAQYSAPTQTSVSQQYTVTDPAGTQQRTTLTLDASSGVFHKGARFDEFAKPSIPPPPPGCPPNHFQQMQMEKGQLNVVITNSNAKHHYENHAFDDTDS